MIDPFHARVARLALHVAQRYGFVLGGGLALIMHGAVDRPTEDIDLFGPDTANVTAAAGVVRAALLDAGFRVEDEPADSDLIGVIDGMDYFMAEMSVYPADSDRDAVRVSLGHLDQAASPVVLDVGPVMAMPDLIAWKVAALVNRAEERDFVDVAAFLADHNAEALLAMARSVDPALEDEDVARAGRRLDRAPDAVFTRYGLDPAGVDRLRARFAAWPR
jgi:hypothetical protein